VFFVFCFVFVFLKAQTTNPTDKQPQVKLSGRRLWQGFQPAHQQV
jgi:hypothetical protein